MSLDVDLMVMQPISVYSRNITHNLNEMASQVVVDENNLTLYDILWKPEEYGFTHARTIVGYLDEGWNILMSDPEFFKQFDPENGWGSYEGLCDFVYTYRHACWANMDAELKVSK
jgi:hypothetical protein